MITRRSLFGLTFGGAVATAVDAHDEKVAEMRRLLDGPASSEPQREDVVVKGESPARPARLPVRITLAEHGHMCKVELGGVDISRNVTALAVVADVHDATRLQLEMFVGEGSEIVGDAGALDVVLKDPHRRLRFEADHVRVKADV